MTLDNVMTIDPAITQLQPNPLDKRLPIIMKKPMALTSNVVSHRRIVTVISAPKSSTITSFGKIFDDKIDIFKK